MNNPKANEDKIIRAAALIVQARKTNSMLSNIPVEIRPTSLSEAYAIQNEVADQLKWSPGGWFCACVNPVIQKQLGLDQPYYGRAVTDHQFESPAHLDTRHYPPLSLECEFAFRLKYDLPARSTPYTKDEVLLAIASVHPAIEAVAGYLEDWISQDVFSVIADNGADGPIIYGSGIDNLSSLDLSKIKVTLTVNGQIERTGSGANVGGNPIDALTWLVNTKSSEGISMKAGFLNNTGTSTNLYAVSPGDNITADFGSLGTVHLKIHPVTT